MRIIAEWHRETHIPFDYASLQRYLVVSYFHIYLFAHSKILLYACSVSGFSYTMKNEKCVFVHFNYMYFLITVKVFEHLPCSTGALQCLHAVGPIVPHILHIRYMRHTWVKSLA